MKKCAYFFLTVFTLLSLASNASTDLMKETPTLKISIGSQVFQANLQSSESTSALIKQLPLTLSMVELNGNEKYAELKQALPTQAESVGKIQSGDLLLYGNNVLVLFMNLFQHPIAIHVLGK